MTTIREHAPFARGADGATRDYLGHLFTFLAGGPDTGGAFALIEATVRKGHEPPPHTHANEDETYYILEGSWAFRVGDRELLAEPGMCVFLPRGVKHGFSIAADGARALVLLTPAGLEDAFQTLSRPTERTAGLPPAPDGPPPIARMVEVFGARGVIFESPN